MLCGVRKILETDALALQRLGPGTKGNSLGTMDSYKSGLSGFVHVNFSQWRVPATSKGWGPDDAGFKVCE